MTIDTKKIEQAYSMILEAIGEDLNRDGLQDTPRRAAKMWNEFIDYDAGKLDTAFESVKTDQLIVVSNIKVWSLCEHHLLPFWCDISIGYIATDKILGLSKFARISQNHAHKLQVQERLVDEIANDIARFTGSNDVAVIGKGEHLCMSMRGIKSPHVMTSSIMRGKFKELSDLRMEFLRLSK